MKLEYDLKSEMEDILQQCDDWIQTRKYNHDLKKIEYCYYLNLEISFDIETSSFRNADDEKRATMYCWMMAIRGKVYLGRTWKEFLQMFQKLKDYYRADSKHKLIVYCHNLSYEFAWLNRWIDVSDVFATDVRKVLYFVADGCVEFRCSYFLSGMSLRKVAEDLTHHQIRKLNEGDQTDLDYRIIRHSETELTESEKAYCVNDVLIVNAYINEQKMIYGNITKIPLTNTGRVRRRISEAVKNDKRAGKWIRSQQMYFDEYKMARFCFQGGFTHANAHMVSKTIEGKISSFDFCSSYPAVMMSERFPSRSGIEVTDMTWKEIICYGLKREVGYMVECEFINLREHFQFEHYISYSKCYDIEGEEVENGRVVNAKRFRTCVTNIDLEIIEQCYDFDDCIINRCYAYTLDYLPKPYIETTFDLFNAKSTLKNVTGFETEYRLKKSELNSLYGMCATELIKDKTVFEDGEWSQPVRSEAEEVNEILKYNSKRNKFVVYMYGVFITAYARRNLWSGILELSEDYIYSDTDSVKCLNADNHMDYFNDYNERVTKKIEECMKHYGMEYVIPKNNKGEECPLGIWDFEFTAQKFKTLGAKRYLYEKDEELHLTCAGVNKKRGAEYLASFKNPFKMFDNNLVFPADKSGRVESFYIDEGFEDDIVDFRGNKYHVVERSGIYMEEHEYSLSMNDFYLSYLKKIGVL